MARAFARYRRPDGTSCSKSEETQSPSSQRSDCSRPTNRECCSPPIRRRISKDSGEQLGLTTTVGGRPGNHCSTLGSSSSQYRIMDSMVAQPPILIIFSLEWPAAANARAPPLRREWAPKPFADSLVKRATSWTLSFTSSVVIGRHPFLLLDSPLRYWEIGMRECVQGKLEK